MAKRPITPEDLLKFQFVSDPQVSPSGEWVLFSKSIITEKNSYLAHLHIVKSTGGEVRQLTHGDSGGGHGRWSPDGRSIAFISGRQKPSAQLFLLPFAGPGEAEALTKLPEGSIGGFAWSPDGRRIAFTFRPTADDRTVAAAEARKAKGESDPPWILDDLLYRMDGDGYFGGQRFAIWIYEFDKKEARKLYEGDAAGFYSFDWMPGGEELIVAHSASKQPLIDPPNSQLYRVDLRGKAKRIPGLPKGDKGAVAVSPNGEMVAYIGNEDLDDPWGTRNNKVYVVGIAGGTPTCLTDSTDYDFTVSTLSDTGAGSDGALTWHPSGKSIFAMVGWHGQAHLAEINLARKTTTLLTEGNAVFGVGNVSADGKQVALTYATTTTLNEVALFDKRVRHLTSLNKSLLAEIELVEPKRHWVPSTDGAKVHTWVLWPMKAKKKVPAVLEIHGGPHTQYGEGFFHEFQLLCAQGYAVAYSNPRGSKGYGQAFCAAIYKDWGNKDWDDIQAVTDWLRAQPGVDTSRVGVMGGSYGGYMTNWAIGHRRDYKAAITDRCVSNWLSAGGNADFPLNRDGYFGGNHWDAYEKVRGAWEQSPISHMAGVTTPTLIIHSEGDLRCNVEQSEQVFSALKMQGVETRFVRYPANSSHGLSRNGPPDLRIHRLKEILAWWKRHLG